MSVWIFLSDSLLLSCLSTSGALMISISMRSLSSELEALHFSMRLALLSNGVPVSKIPLTLELALLVARGMIPLTIPLI